MNLLDTFLFIIFPYLCLTVFVLGHGYRYITDRYTWNTRSSEFLEKKSLFAGSMLFHYGIIFTFLGHASGLLIPQRLLDRIGIDSQIHTFIAHWSGLAVGIAAFLGLVLLFRRRMTNPRVRAVNRLNDTVTLCGLFIVISMGLFNVIFGNYDVLYTIAPWIRGIVTFTPDAMLIKAAPLNYKIHIITALALLGFSPFSRLVHIWSVPVTYLFRRWILFRRQARQL